MLDYLPIQMPECTFILSFKHNCENQSCGVWNFGINSSDFMIKSHSFRVHLIGNIEYLIFCCKNNKKHEYCETKLVTPLRSSERASFDQKGRWCSLRSSKPVSNWSVQAYWHRNLQSFWWYGTREDSCKRYYATKHEIHWGTPTWRKLFVVDSETCQIGGADDWYLYGWVEFLS